MAALWLRTDPLLLASKSAVRRTLLAGAGLPLEVVAADVDERAMEREAGSIGASELAALLAAAKAAAVGARHPDRIVVGADQTLACGGKVYSKPADRAAARDQLRSLAGTTHDLHAAVAVWANGALAFAHVSTARLTMRAFTDAFLDSYLDAAGDAVTTSVGAYQLEGIGIHLFEKIEGDYFTILGLPLLPLLGFLRQRGLVEE